MVNALQFKTLTAHSLSGIETKALEHAEIYLSNKGSIISSVYLNALQFKAVTGYSLSEIETNALEHAEKFLANHGLNPPSVLYPS